MNPYLDNENFKILEAFATMDIWRNKIDLVYIFQVPPVTSIKREYANLLTRKKGSIMNKKVLETYNLAINDVVEKHGKKFRRIEKIDTTNADPNDVGYVVTHTILSTLKDMLEEKIGYFPASISTKFQQGIIPIEVLENSRLNFFSREEIEISDNIQPIPHSRNYGRI